MGYSSIEEYKRAKQELDKENRKKWYKDHKDHRAEQVRNYRNKQREEIGDEESKKNATKSKRDYISSMSEEDYKRYKDRENEYWRNRRKNETEEERKERLLKASIWRKQRALNETLEEREERLRKRRASKALSKQKKIDKLGIEEYNRIEFNRSKQYLDSLSEDKRREIYDRNNAYQRKIILTESKEERDNRLNKKRKQRRKNREENKKSGKEKKDIKEAIKEGVKKIGFIIMMSSQYLYSVLLATTYHHIMLTYRLRSRRLSPILTTKSPGLAASTLASPVLVMSQRTLAP